LRLVAQDANQPLPRLSFLVAERTAHVGEHQQLVWEAALPERAAPHFPAPGAPGKRERIDTRRIARQRGGETEARRVAAEQLLRRSGQQGRA